MIQNQTYPFIKNEYEIFDNDGYSYLNEEGIIECIMQGKNIVDLVVEGQEHNKTINWTIPKKYAEFDIENYLIGLCKSEEELNRVLEELILYKELNSYDILRLVHYIVETLRKHKIIWGVGRGSSVASYCLYLLGLHKINSIKYKLDYREFLK